MFTSDTFTFVLRMPCKYPISSHSQFIIRLKMFFAGFRRKSNEKNPMPALILSNFWYLSDIAVVREVCAMSKKIQT